MTDNNSRPGFLRRLAYKLIEWISPDLAENVKGDLEEVYTRTLRESGRWLAEWRFFLEAITCFKLALNARWRVPEYLIGASTKLSIRVLIKNKSYLFINVFGLGLGLASAMVIFLFVRTEKSYDSYHQHADNIFRVVYDLTERNEKRPWAISKGKWPEIIAQEYPEVIDFVRIIPTWGSKSLMKSEEQSNGFYEEGFVWADPSITSVFDLNFTAGDPNTALEAPGTILVTTAVAEKYFGSPGQALGKVINRDNETDYTITGVIKPMPSHSHFHASFIASLMTATTREERQSFWGYSYLRLSKGADPARLVGQFPNLIAAHEKQGSVLKLDLQALKSIYLHSDLLYEFETVGEVSVIYMFSATGIFIILIAAFNYINLSTAYGMRRIKEVGIKKVLGADKKSLFIQLISESTIVAFFALVIAALMVYLTLPVFELLAGKQFSTLGLDLWAMVSGLLAASLVLGLLAGVYPALYIASFGPSQLFQKDHGFGKATFRKFLTVFQFGLSVMLIVGSLVVYKQLDYFHQKDLGLDAHQALVIPLDYAKELGENYRAFRNEILAHPRIHNSSMMSNLPGELIRMWTGDIRPAGGSEEDNIRAKVFTTDYDFVSTLGLTVTAGRDFSRMLASDTAAAVLINQEAAKLLGMDPVIGQYINVPSRQSDFRVIGVVEDFHFASLHAAIEPLIIYNKPGPMGKLVLRMETKDLTETMQYVDEVWSRYEPDRPLESFFLNEYFNRKYETERTILNLLLTLTFLAIVIAGLGLFGLATYVSYARYKEVAIRKVLGASVGKLFVLLSSEFGRLIMLAFLIVGPVAFYFADRWLAGFAYRIEVDFFIFGLAGIFVLTVALVTVGYQCLKVARANPTDVLEEE